MDEKTANCRIYQLFASQREQHFGFPSNLQSFVFGDLSQDEKKILDEVTVHTASFWNIIIQWTSHDDLTEKLVLAKPPQFFRQITMCNFKFLLLTSFFFLPPSTS